jgi:S-adenosyl-L-methionine hydrolase (adenosine-forming)
LAPRPIITLTTDFGLTDHYVGIIKGVLLHQVPEAQIVDICHSVQPFDVLDGALAIAESYSYFPSGTIHMVVVDPGVGSARRPIVVHTQKHVFVAPDNGVLSLIYEREERIDVRHITAEHYFLQPVSATFHARDIFAPIAAQVAKGVSPEKLGEKVDDFVRFTAPKPKPVDARTLRGVVLKVDRFGNLITNIAPADAPALFGENAPSFRITVGGYEVLEMKTNYAQGAPGQVFGILGSMGYLEIVANRGAAAKATGAGKGAEVLLTLDGAAAAGTR